jgi:hypothetical protein
MDILVGIDSKNELRRMVIGAVLPKVWSRLTCGRRSAADRTLTVQRSSTPLLGHDHRRREAVRARRPEGRQFKLKAARASRIEGQTDEPTRMGRIID